LSARLPISAISAINPCPWPQPLHANLIRRERQRQEKGHSGLMVGDDAALFAFQDVVRRRRPTLRVTVVQPGLSRAKAQARHLQLLGAADVYVAEVAYGAFDVWCSA
jgi:hypothetical protein